MCRRFLVSLCMFTVSKALLMSTAIQYNCVRRGVICLNPLAIIVLILCSMGLWSVFACDMYLAVCCVCLCEEIMFVEMVFAVFMFSGG